MNARLTTLKLLPLLLITGGAVAADLPVGGAAGRKPGGHSLPAAVITFRPTAEVGGRVVRLADIAVVEGADPRLVSRLEAVDVGAAPLHGHSRSVSAAYAQVRIRQIGVDLARLQFHGPELVTVSRPEQVVSGSVLQKAACEAVEAANPGAVAQVSFVPADIRLPAGAVQLQPEAAGLVSGTSGSLVVRVLVDGQEETRVSIGFRLLRMSPTLVAARDLRVGRILTAEDLKVEQRPAEPGPSSLSDVSQALGQQMTYPVRGGGTLTTMMLKPAVLIKRGARVRLICRGPGFTVTAMGEALQDGAAGQPIRIRNLTSMRELSALVADAETAEVTF